MSSDSKACAYDARCLTVFLERSEEMSTHLRLEANGSSKVLSDTTQVQLWESVSSLGLLTGLCPVATSRGSSSKTAVSRKARPSVGNSSQKLEPWGFPLDVQVGDFQAAWLVCVSEAGLPAYDLEEPRTLYN